MYLNETIYKYKPYAITFLGAMVVFAINNPLAYVGGGLLILAGAIIYRMRTEPK